LPVPACDREDLGPGTTREPVVRMQTLALPRALVIALVAAVSSACLVDEATEGVVASDLMGEDPDPRDPLEPTDPPDDPLPPPPPDDSIQLIHNGNFGATPWSSQWLVEGAVSGLAPNSTTWPSCQTVCALFSSINGNLSQYVSYIPTDVKSLELEFDTRRKRAAYDDFLVVCVFVPHGGYEQCTEVPASYMTDTAWLHKKVTLASWLFRGQYIWIRIYGDAGHAYIALDNVSIKLRR
jgi:hypothetical protein